MNRIPNLESLIRYNRKGGEVWIESEVLESSVAISICNNGLGIDPADQEKLTNRFFRVDTARTHGDNGYGLGLSIAKRIVDLHHGELHVASKHGLGSTFTVVLPLYSESTYSESPINM